jgi:sulfatase maturation enzyme AslB (radical SAM superfamily)
LNSVAVPVVFIDKKKFPPKNLKGYFCLSPFINIHISVIGEVHLCPCPGWGDTRIGNILTETLEQMLSSPKAQRIRQSIIDGTYDYCDENQCALIINGNLNTADTLPLNVARQIEDASLHDMPYEIALNVDSTCNLSCPSCRTKVTKISEEDIARQEEISQRIFQNIFSKPSSQRIHLVTSGAGEVFSSPMIQSFLGLLNLKDFPNIAISLHSNGLLAEKNWHRVKHIESAISNVTISVDAARPDTYEKIRRGGQWPDILRSLEFLKNKKEAVGFKFNTRMIVQQSNFREILEFYSLCKLYNVDRVEYSRLTNWNTWDKHEFKTHDVFNNLHPEKIIALDLINQAKLLPDTWFEGNFN